jgi:micrococcal nuclease
MTRLIYKPIHYNNIEFTEVLIEMTEPTPKLTSNELHTSTWENQSITVSSQEYPLEMRNMQSCPTITSYLYNGSIYRWIDGDTVEVVLDLGLKIAHRTIVRLYGLNAPEKNTKEGQLLIEHLNLNYPSNSPIVIQTIKDKKEKYGRYLGIIYTTQLSEEAGKIVSKNTNINDYLLANNFAKILKY